MHLWWEKSSGGGTYIDSPHIDLIRNRALGLLKQLENYEINEAIIFEKSETPQCW